MPLAINADLARHFLKQIDGGGGVQGQVCRANACREFRAGGIKFDNDLHRCAPHTRQHLGQAGQSKAKKLAWKDEIFAQTGKTFEQTLVMRKQPFVFGKTDLLNGFGGKSRKDRIAIFVQPPQRNPRPVAKDLFIERRRLIHRSGQVQGQCVG